MSPKKSNKDLENNSLENSLSNDETFVSTNNENEQAIKVSMDYNSISKSELIGILKDLIAKDINLIKEEVENIKLQFYKKHKTEVEELKKKHIENGGSDENFSFPKDSQEELFKSLLNEYKLKKNLHIAKIEQEKENNLLLKQNILEQMKSLVEKNDEVSTHINEFKNLQQRWKNIGLIPQSSINEIWKQYNIYQERFWDLVKINNELREYDFKKNLESKTSICEKAEKLDNEKDVIFAFQKLQKLHEEWHELGPVAKELREEVWTRFKEATSIINKKHQIYFESLKQVEEENLSKKTELCEKIENIDYDNINTYKAWEEITNKMHDWQIEWKNIGFAPRKFNQKIFERYRQACDIFFSKKSNFYKESKNQLASNADRKKALCLKAEELKESKDWKETAEKLTELQKEWKTIGPVPKKTSDELWKRFIGACDYFFHEKNKINSQKTIEHENLAKKRELIAKIIDFKISDEKQNSVTLLKEMMTEWNSIGHVPYKEKDKVYLEFKNAIDSQFNLLNNVHSRKKNNFSKNKTNNLQQSDSNNKLENERSKLYREYEHLKSEIAIYENNIGFLTSSSKKGSNVITEMEKKIEALKKEYKAIELKIIEIDEKDSI